MELIVLFILVLLNGIFAMSEIALVSLRRSKLEAAAQKGDSRAMKALELSQHPNRFLSTVQIGITLIGILTGVYSGDKISEDLAVYLHRFAILQPYSEVVSVLLVVFLITYLSLVFGELIPKRIGLNNAENIAKTVARPMSWLATFAAPFIWLLTASSDLFMKIFHLNTEKDDQVTEEEIKAVLIEGVKSGSIEKIEHSIVERVFHLGDRKVSSLMTPSVDLVWLNIHDDAEINKEKILESGHSVFPVGDKTLDQLVGVISIKEVLKNGIHNSDYLKEAKPPIYVNENVLAYQLLDKFRQARTYFALVTDEYGAISGAITLKDLLGVLLGSISEVQDHEDEIVQREDGSYLIDASISIHDFLNYFNIEDKALRETDDFNSLGGFVLVHARSIPKVGFKFTWKNFELEVVDMDGRRIDKILVRNNKL